jgi:hypothetical protein
MPNRLALVLDSTYIFMFGGEHLRNSPQVSVLKKLTYPIIAQSRQEFFWRGNLEEDKLN